MLVKGAPCGISNIHRRIVVCSFYAFQPDEIISMRQVKRINCLILIRKPGSYLWALYIKDSGMPVIPLLPVGVTRLHSSNFVFSRDKRLWSGGKPGIHITCEIHIRIRVNKQQYLFLFWARIGCAFDQLVPRLENIVSTGRLIWGFLSMKDVWLCSRLGLICVVVTGYLICFSLFDINRHSQKSE